MRASIRTPRRGVPTGSQAKCSPANHSGVGLRLPLQNRRNRPCLNRSCLPQTHTLQELKKRRRKAKGRKRHTKGLREKALKSRPAHIPCSADTALRLSALTPEGNNRKTKLPFLGNFEFRYCYYEVIAYPLLKSVNSGSDFQFITENGRIHRKNLNEFIPVTELRFRNQRKSQ